MGSHAISGQSSQTSSPYTRQPAPPVQTPANDRTIAEKSGRADELSVICSLLCLALIACKDRSPSREATPTLIPPTPDAVVVRPPPTPPGYGPIDENDPAYKDMVSIPEDFLRLGDTKHWMQAFLIDRTEVTVAQYRECISLGACRAPQLRQPYYGDEGCVRDLGTWSQTNVDDHPITCVSAADAYAYCMQLGKRLPTRYEWVYAARGNVDNRTYPWGDEKPTCSDVAVGMMVVKGSPPKPCPKVRTRPVGTTKLDVSPFGVHDLAANVAELVMDQARQPRPQPDEPRWSVMGAGVTGYTSELAIDNGHSTSPTSPGVGFRCAAGGKPY